KKAAAPAKKAGAAKPKKVAKAAPEKDELDPSREWSLDEVEPHLPPVPQDEVQLLKEMLLGAHTEQTFVAWGAQYRTDDILGAAPPFLVGCLGAVAKLGGPPPGLSLGYFPLLLDAARELHELNTRFAQEQRAVASTISGRRAQLKLANSRALDARRNLAQTLLRSVIPADSKYRAELEAAAAGTDNYAGTVASVRSFVSITTELRQIARLPRFLASLQYGEGHIASVSRLADDVDELSKLAPGLKPPQRTSQTTLDQQDGLVCAIMRAIWVHSPPAGGCARAALHQPAEQHQGRGRAAAGTGRLKPHTRERARRAFDGRRARDRHRGAHRARLLLANPTMSQATARPRAHDGCCRIACAPTTMNPRKACVGR